MKTQSQRQFCYLFFISQSWWKAIQGIPVTHLLWRNNQNVLLMDFIIDEMPSSLKEEKLDWRWISSPLEFPRKLHFYSNFFSVVLSTLLKTFFFFLKIIESVIMACLIFFFFNFSVLKCSINCRSLSSTSMLGPWGVGNTFLRQTLIRKNIVAFYFQTTRPVRNPCRPLIFFQSSCLLMVSRNEHKIFVHFK